MKKNFGCGHRQPEAFKITDIQKLEVFRSAFYG